MVRVISQQTYDEVVNENIEQFDMTPEEAVDDAIKQFEAQGVDLSNIIKDLILTNDNDLISSYLDQIKNSIEDGEFEGIPFILDKLRNLLEKDIARRVFAGKNNGYKILIELMKKCIDNKTVLKPALKAITALMTGNPDILDSDGIALQMDILDNQTDITTIQYCLRWIRECCIKHEMNRQNIFSANIFDKIKKLLMREEATGSELKDACSVIRSLVLDDDIRHDYGKAHEHASHIARGALGVLTTLVSKFHGDKSVVGDLMITMASLIVRNEFCQDVKDAGGLKFILDVMTDYPQSEKLTWQALKLLKALAGNDNVKAHIITSGSAPLIVSALSRLKNSETLVVAALACISALSLKSPSNAGVFYDCGAPMVIVDAMKAYPNNMNVIRHASWAIRNMAVRNKMEAKEFIVHGIEEILQNALQIKDTSLESDVKAALRDLGLKVELKERWTGKGHNIEKDSK